MYNRVVYGSIGCTTGAALGASKALREIWESKRRILVTSKGSWHLTVETFADALKLGVRVES